MRTGHDEIARGAAKLRELGALDEADALEELMDRERRGFAVELERSAERFEIQVLAFADERLPMDQSPRWEPIRLGRRDLDALWLSLLKMPPMDAGAERWMLTAKGKDLAGGEDE